MPFKSDRLIRKACAVAPTAICVAAVAVMVSLALKLPVRRPVEIAHVSRAEEALKQSRGVQPWGILASRPEQIQAWILRFVHEGHEGHDHGHGHVCETCSHSHEGFFRKTVRSIFGKSAKLGASANSALSASGYSAQDVGKLKKMPVMFAEAEKASAFFRAGPSQTPLMALGASDDPQLARRLGKWMGEGFRTAGVDALLGPRLEAFDPDRPGSKGWHCLTGNLEKLAPLARAYMEGAHEGGAVPVMMVSGWSPCEAVRQLCQAAPGNAALALNSFEERGSNAVLPAQLSRMRGEMGWGGLLLTDFADETRIQKAPGGEPRFVVDALRLGADLVLCPRQTLLGTRALMRAKEAGALSSELFEASQTRKEEFLRKVEELRSKPLPDKEQWEREGEALAKDLLQQAMIEFGLGEAGRRKPLSVWRLRKVVGTAQAPDLSGLLKRLDFDPKAFVSELRPSHDDAESSEGWCILYFNQGSGSTLGRPWTPEELDWLRKAERANTPLTIVVFGNPLAGSSFARGKHVNGLVTWGYSQAAADAVHRWFDGQFHPAGKWPFALSQEKN